MLPDKEQCNFIGFYTERLFGVHFIDPDIAFYNRCEVIAVFDHREGSFISIFPYSLLHVRLRNPDFVAGIEEIKDSLHDYRHHPGTVTERMLQVITIFRMKRSDQRHSIFFLGIYGEAS